MSFIQYLFIIALLITISAFFSLSEISLAAARKIKLRQIAESDPSFQRRINAERVLTLQAAPGNFFTVVQIGLNAVAVLGGIMGEQALSPMIELAMRPFYSGSMLGSIAFVTSFLFVTTLFVLFADLIPKRLAIVHPEQIALLVVRPIFIAMWLFAPLVFVFTRLADLMLHAFGVPIARAEDVTADDIVAMADAGAQTGALLRQEQHLISNVFELDSRIVPSAMTSREGIVYLTLDESEESIRSKIAEQPHSKFPVCDHTLDSVIGYVDSKDIWPRIINGEEVSLRTQPIIRKVLMLPETLSLFEALERFRDAKEDFALVLNEYAIVVGLLTLQDVMNTVMGDLVSPFQEELIVRRDDQSWLIDGMTPIEDVMQALDIDVFEGFENYETIAGFLIYRLRKMPKRTDCVLYQDYKFEVVDIDNHRIDQVLVTRELTNKDDISSSTGTRHTG